MYKYNYKKPLSILSVLFIVLIIGIITPSRVQASLPYRYERIYGSDRFKTCSKIAEQATSSYYAVMVNGMTYADAITASPIAYQYTAPILLTQKDTIPTTIVNTLKKLQVKQVIIIGGTGVVSDKVVKQLTNMGISIKERISGADRFDTSINVSKQLAPINWNAYVIKDDDWISGIMVSPLACSQQAPIIYSSDVGLKPEGSKILKDKEKLKNFDILDTKAISDYFINTNISLTNNIKDSVNDTLVGGRTRSIFNKQFLEHYSDKFNFNTVYLVSNKSFADGLCVATLAGATDSPIIPVGNDNIDEVAKYISDNADKFTDFKIIGGEQTIPDSIETKIWDNINQSPNAEDDANISRNKAVDIISAKTNNYINKDSLECEGSGQDYYYTDTNQSLSDNLYWFFIGDDDKWYLVDKNTGESFKQINQQNGIVLFHKL